MLGFIDNYNFKEMEPMKYYQPPASWSDEKKKENIRSKIFSNEWYGARKMDGYFSQLIKDEDGNILLLSRSRGVNGDFPEKHEWVPQLNSFFDSIPNGTCLLGELYLPSKPGSRNITTILGCLKEKAIARQDKDERLHFYCFDILAYNGENLLNKSALERFKLVRGLSEDFGNYEYVEFATYYNGNQLWDELGSILAEGGEGVVITKSNGIYEPGKRPSKTTLKVKKEISQTIDCFFTGRGTPPTKEYKGKEIETWKYWINPETEERLPLSERCFDYDRGALIMPVTKPYYYKWCGSLEIALVKDGKAVPIGFLSGLTDEIKSNPEAYKGRVIEVTAMEIDKTNHSLRHGKMLQFRDDKTYKECEWSQIE